MSKIFLTSDWHFDHGRIITYCRRLNFMNDRERKNFLDAEARGATSEEMKQLQYSPETVDRMNSAIIDNINKIVGQDDEIWNLGDVIFGGRGIGKLRRLRQRIIANKICLVLGNHDKDIVKLWNAGDLRDVFADAYFVTQQPVKINVGEQEIWLSHYAHVVWDQFHKPIKLLTPPNVWNCFGHSHASLNEHFNEYFPGRLMKDVGIDSAFKILGEYRPFSLEEATK